MITEASHKPYPVGATSGRDPGPCPRPHRGRRPLLPGHPALRRRALSPIWRRKTHRPEAGLLHPRLL